MSFLSRQPRVDPDTNVSRLERAFNQFEGEVLLLEKTSRCSADERLIMIRKMIFRGFDNVWGTVAEEVLAEVSVTDWPDKKLTKDHLWTAFTRKIDALSDQLARDQAIGKEAAAIRLGVLVYFFGILLHPSIDANGQSFRLLALTYVRQHAPHFGDSFFPIKYVQDYGKSLQIYPFSERLVREIIPHLPVTNQTDNGSVKEDILATLLTTRKGHAFLEEYVFGTLNSSPKPKDSYPTTALIFQTAFHSLEKDFRTCLERENSSVHAKKHACMQKLLEDGKLSRDHDFLLSREETERIAKLLSAHSSREVTPSL